MYPQINMKTLSIFAVFTLLSAFTLGVMGDDPKPPPRFTCECDNGARPVLFEGLCRCGTCEKVDEPINTYIKQCKKDAALDEFADALIRYCSNEENTEDCEYFKKEENVPGHEELPDKFKKCRDIFDAIGDDCEDAKECCYKLDDPKKIAEEAAKKDD